MARYNTFLYGTNETYGASAVTEGGNVTWILLVDWDNSGSYDGTNEADKLKNCSIVRGRQNYLSEQGGGFEHMRPGKAVLTLDNNPCGNMGNPDRRVRLVYMLPSGPTGTKSIYPEVFFINL